MPLTAQNLTSPHINTFLYPTLNICSQQQNTNCYRSERIFYCSNLFLRYFLFEEQKSAKIQIIITNCIHHFKSLMSIFAFHNLIIDLMN